LKVDIRIAQVSITWSFKHRALIAKKDLSDLPSPPPLGNQKYEKAPTFREGAWVRSLSLFAPLFAFRLFTKNEMQLGSSVRTTECSEMIVVVRIRFGVKLGQA